MQHPLAARRQAQPTGVIETLSAGYRALNRQLWVLLLPILVDLFLWLGPHVSYAPLVDPTVTRVAEWMRQVALGPRRAPRNADVLALLDQTRLFVISRVDDVNGLAAVSWGPLAVPSLGVLPGPSDDLAFVTGWLDGLGLLLACGALSLLLGALFYAGLAGASTGIGRGPLAAGRYTPRAMARVLGLSLVLLATALLLGLPVVLLIGFTALIAPPLAALAGLLVGLGVLFAVVHLFFAVDAVFVSHAGPLSAIQRSVVLVRRHLRSSIGLIMLTWLILAGMGRLWDVLASTLQPPFGVGLSIVGNAYIASGLIAAGMIFYTQRTADAAEQH